MEVWERDMRACVHVARGLFCKNSVHVMEPVAAAQHESEPRAKRPRLEGVGEDGERPELDRPGSPGARESDKNVKVYTVVCK